MILTIDIGNTNIVVGAVYNGEICFTSRILTNKNLTSDQYYTYIKNILLGNDIFNEQIKDCIICSVVPPVLKAVFDAVFKIIKKEPIIVLKDKLKIDLNFLIDNPEQLGTDLIVTSVAAIKQFKPPLIVIDMGTATTVSVIDKDKNYMGGLIIPGAKISLDALSNKTAQLPFISIDAPKNKIGKNTIERMQSGIIFGNSCMIDGIINMIQKDFDEKLNIIATGGIASYIIPFCETKIIYDENLMLKGLYEIYLNNIN